MRQRGIALVALVLLAVQGPALSPDGGRAWAQQRSDTPEGASGIAERALATAQRHMISAANPLAAAAGLEILRAGGNAVDAAIAVQMVLNLVEPQSSGLGGGAFLLVYDRAVGRLASYDGRETAPGRALPDRFMRHGQALAFGVAARSGRAVGVPGVLAALELAHRTHGRLPWARLFAPAIRIAEEGFIVSPRLATLLAAERASTFAPVARRAFFDDDGRPWPVGARMQNRELAVTLRRVALEGPAAFYSGLIAEAIVEAVARDPRGGGDLSLADLARYRAIERPPVCIPYRRVTVCGMGPPSSGGLAIAMALAMLERFDLGRGPASAMSPRALHLMAEAARLAYADRDRYIGDPDHVPVPVGLLDRAYLRERAARIDPARAADQVEAGRPPGLDGRIFGADATTESPGTSHVSIIDADGNAVALTSTIESAFGSGIAAAGFLLNNQLTDFSFRPMDADGRLAANAVGPGRRPRSSMAPTMIFDDRGQLLAVLGSPGGSRIILYVL